MPVDFYRHQATPQGVLPEYRFDSNGCSPTTQQSIARIFLGVNPDFQAYVTFTLKNLNLTGLIRVIGEADSVNLK